VQRAEGLSRGLLLVEARSFVEDRLTAGEQDRVELITTAECINPLEAREYELTTAEVARVDLSRELGEGV
jgi:hypothetical protein